MRPPRILLVEDSLPDRVLLAEACARAGIEFRFLIAQDGVEALELLRSEAASPDGGRPDLILLDLNLPRMGGRELLGRLRGDEKLRQIPVMILTSSTMDRDLITQYDLPTDHYVVKPFSFDGYVQFARRLGDYLSGLTLASS